MKCTRISKISRIQWFWFVPGDNELHDFKSFVTFQHSIGSSKTTVTTTTRQILFLPTYNLDLHDTVEFCQKSLKLCHANCHAVRKQAVSRKRSLWPYIFLAEIDPSMQWLHHTTILICWKNRICEIQHFKWGIVVAWQSSKTSYTRVY